MHDIVIVGGGPGGYAAALYAHNFGLDVVLVEKERVGGTCLIRGCIPAKTWLQAAEVFTTVRDSAEFGVMAGEPTFDWAKGLERKNTVVDGLVRGLSGLLKQRKVEVVNGFGSVTGPNTVVVDAPDGGRTIEAHHLIVATGSVPSTIPNFDLDGHLIVSSDHALDWESQPARVAIIGAGIIGCEFASLLTDLGSEVTVFELLDQVLPGVDAAAGKELQKHLRRRGVKFRTGTAVNAPQLGDNSVTLTWGKDKSLEVDVVLVAVGRRPITDGIGLENTKARVDERGFLIVDLTTMQSNEPSVYAVGDVVADTPGLAHGAFAEAIAAVTHIATGQTAPVDYRALPNVVYTHPELAEVGLSEEKAQEAGYEVEVHSHSFVGVGRAIIVGQNQGTVRIVAEKDGPILGASVVGPHAGEMIHELMYAVGWEALPAEAAAFVHAHPTLSEAVGETLLASSGRSLH